MEDHFPFGLGWVRWLADPRRAAHLGPGERYSWHLSIGVLCAGSIVGVLSTAWTWTVSPRLAGLTGGWTVAVGATLVAILTDPRRMFALLHVNCAASLGLIATVAILTEGLATVSLNAIWGLSSPIVATLVVGRRAGAVWFVGWLAMLGVVAVVPPLRWPLAVAEVDVTGTLLTNALLFGTLTLLALQWFVEQRELAEAGLARERARADGLLRNVLPEAIAERLKAGARVAEEHAEVTVLFADVVGFTTLSAHLAPDELLRMLDDLFRELDALVDAHGVEKIKTIGDCYMVAAGAPDDRRDHCEAVARLAIAMRDHVATHAFGGRALELRIGLHTGPAIAGVIGTRRFLYDLWGDTVNTASRMESHGQPGAIHVSEPAAERLRGSFEIEERGPIEVKGKGTMRTYWLRGARVSARRSERSTGGKG